MATLDWGYADNSSEAPYFINFDCWDFARTSTGRADIVNGAGVPVQSIVMPGCAVGRGSSHRYSEDSTMSENLAQALATVDESFTGLNDSSNVNDLLNDAEKMAGGLALRYQKEAFGHINSTLGRIEMLTTEAAYLGSSKRKYNFYWNLKSTSRGSSDSDRASLIAYVFESLSLPVVGGFGGEGTISNATRMEPPPIWTFYPMTTNGRTNKDLTRTWLGEPKPCVLANVMSNVDNQAFYYEDGSKPFSYNLTLTFIELENVLNDGFGMVSRSEFFDGLGG
jgi:hypothetical protein